MGKQIRPFLFFQSWRASFMVSGIPGLFVALLLLFTVKDPESNEGITNVQSDGDIDSKISSNSPSENVENKEKSITDEVFKIKEIDELKPEDSAWKLCLNPVILVLGLAACVRHSGIEYCLHQIQYVFQVCLQLHSNTMFSSY